MLRWSLPGRVGAFYFNFMKSFCHSVYTDELPGGTAYLGEAMGSNLKEIIADVKRRKMHGINRVRLRVGQDYIIIERLHVRNV